MLAKNPVNNGSALLLPDHSPRGCRTGVQDGAPRAGAEPEAPPWAGHPAAQRRGDKDGIKNEYHLSKNDRKSHHTVDFDRLFLEVLTILGIVDGIMIDF